MWFVLRKKLEHEFGRVIGVGIVNVLGAHVVRHPRQARRLRRQVDQFDRLILRHVQLDPSGHEILQRRIELDEAAFDHVCEQCSGERLGDRADFVHCVGVRLVALAAVDFAEAKDFLFAVVENSDDATDDVFGLDQRRDQLFDLLRVVCTIDGSD